ncbi:SEN1 N terminal-domain-containing protein [Infundibulicybe gibba]|nr:SEN1 N terminal-domain-containing protein [Infundibulicybe gibba]
MPVAQKEVERLVTAFRETPVDSNGISDKDMVAIFDYLVGLPLGPSGKIHWFCSEATPLTTGAATFLLRLHAYGSDRVAIWEKMLSTCLAGCSNCVRGLQEAKHQSATTYFGAFADDILRGFFASFARLELKMVLSQLTAEGIVDSTGLRKNLSLASPAVVYWMVSNWVVFEDARILSTFDSLCPRDLISAWPTDPVPPGILALIIHRNPDVRQWARKHASQCNIIPVPDTTFIGPYQSSIEAIVSALRTNPSTTPVTSAIHSQFSLDSEVLWEDMPQFCDLQLDLRFLVTDHLHVDGPRQLFQISQVLTLIQPCLIVEFIWILRCCLFLLKRMGNGFWTAGDPEYPQLVFDSMKNNQSFLLLLQNVDVTGERPWYLAWFLEYLNTIRPLPVHGDILAKVVDFLCDDLQQERFGDVRLVYTTTAARILRQHIRDGTSRNKDAAGLAFGRHLDVFVLSAFDRLSNNAKWKDARTAARDLVISFLKADVQGIATVINELCKLLGQITAKRSSRVELTPLLDQKQAWVMTYSTLQTDDTEGIAIIISILASVAHFDILNKQPYLTLLSLPNPGKGYENGESALTKVNDMLKTISDGFTAMVSKYTDYNVPATALELLRRNSVAKHAMMLMLSPMENVQFSAQALVGLAFDVDVRLDCFRSLLENLPDAALEGIFDFLTIFIEYAPAMPEACSVSKSLVRCFTDIIELWKLMTQSLTVIFKRTPLWSTYFDAADMVVWMRDALIFGRDMLAQWRVIEKAANTRYQHDKDKARALSAVGKKMVNDLQDVLPELARWMRLTDEELLHQSFTLLQTLLDCFRETQVAPAPAALSKLTKFVEDARVEDPTRQKTRLDSNRMRVLENSLMSFEDEVVEISPPTNVIVKPKPPKKPEQPAPSKAPPNHILKASKVKAPSRPSSVPSGSTTPTSVIAQPIKDGSSGRSVASEASQSGDDSSEEDNARGGLAALGKIQRSPKIKKPVERRQIKTLDMPTTENPTERRLRRDHDSRKLNLRMKPDISALHKSLLSWDYDHTEPIPPGNKPIFVHVPDRFADYETYRRIFEPLLLLECWSQILQSKEEQHDTFDCKIVSRQFSDAWLDLDVTINGNVQKEWYLSETDVVLLRHLDGKKSLLAKTQSYRSMPHTIQASLRCFIQGKTTDPGLQINTSWHLSKVFSLSTLHREYAALVSLPSYDFCDLILQPTLPKIPKIDPHELQQAMKTYSVNEPQAAAIVGSLKADGFALIQGPPGTGKTSTICGLVAMFLSQRARPPVPVHVGKNTAAAEKNSGAKVLLCAPSNAAIDEIAHRIKEGYRGSERQSNAAKVVRLGTDKSMNISVRDISLDYLVDQRLDTDRQATTDTGSEIRALRQEIQSVKQTRQEKIQELDQIQDPIRHASLEAEIKQLNSRRMALTQKFDRMKDQQKSDYRTLDALRRKIRLQVLHEADVICTTLSGAGHETLQQFDFEMVIIDEAAQAIELSSLIPLRYRCARCIMVGDPQQLPPTVLSQEACRYQYNQSLFVRLQKHQPDSVYLLSIQYRMHPDISRLPSQLFYQGRLHDGPHMDTKTKQVWHSHPKFGTYKFLTLLGAWNNPTDVAIALYARLCQEFTTFDFDFRVGVVTMYRAQIVELRRQFEARFGQGIIGKVDFNTVDGFQGQEKDIIILSCVRAGPGLQSVGFLSDTRRMNVALTRAKSSLYILGHAATLDRSDPVWRNIVQDAKSRALLVDVDQSYFNEPNSMSYRPAPSRTITPAKPTPAPVPPDVPSNLMTPREMQMATQTRVTQPLEPPANTQTLEPPIERAQDLAIANPGVSEPRTVPDPIPKEPEPAPAPPIKRPKPKPKTKGPNIFIPKPTKRPAPDGPAGPSTNRRRL